MGDLTPAEFVALARVLAEDADTLRDTFARELADVLRRVERRLPVIVAQATGGGVVPTSQAASLGRLRGNLRRLLTEAGYEDLVDASLGGSLDRTLAILAETSPAYRRALAFDTTGRPTAFTGILRALIETARADVIGQGDVIATALWRATVRGVIGAETPARLIGQLATVLDGEVAKAARLYDTNVSIVQRVSVQTIVPTADIDVTDPNAPLPLAMGGDVLPVPDDQLYAYVGPVDGLIRPFCLEHVGKVYTKAEIDALDNGQLPNTFLTGGGYNCRHLWAPIGQFDAAADLHGTDGRVEEVEAALARVKPIAKAERVTTKPPAQLPAPAPPPAPADPRPKARLREVLPDLGFTAKGDHATIYRDIYRDAERILKRTPTAGDMMSVVDAWAEHTSQLRASNRQGTRWATLAAIRIALGGAK